MVLEHLGGSGRLVGFISTYPGTSPTPRCRVMTENHGGEDLFLPSPVSKKKHPTPPKSTDVLV